MDRLAFRILVSEAIAGLPSEIRDQLDNVDVVVEDWPTRTVLAKAGRQHPAQLLGFYEGIPQTRRTRHYELILPDKISIFQHPIELQCRTSQEVRNLVQHVVRHEIAHHFGIDDARLRELDAY
jgi:predicted Zn-dependent protease with MMP-like domain